MKLYPVNTKFVIKCIVGTMTISILGVILTLCIRAKCLYAECHYAECRYDECRGAVYSVRLLTNIQIWNGTAHI